LLCYRIRGAEFHWQLHPVNGRQKTLYTCINEDNAKRAHLDAICHTYGIWKYYTYGIWKYYTYGIWKYYTYGILVVIRIVATQPLLPIS